MFMNVLLDRGRPETVGVITLSHRGDLERCALMFETLDRHVPRRGRHYVIVDDEDLPLFAQFRRGDREILPISRFLPNWLRPIPFLRWRGRRYWRTGHGTPVNGWHIQQIVKIEAARSLPEERFCLIDSDIYFFRDFDLGAVAHPARTPLHIHPRGVTTERPRHMLWVASASRLIGTPEPDLPADDYIDQIIVWDQRTVCGMVARVEAVTGHDWVAALCQDRNFSEYMLYGTYVTSTPSALERHLPTALSFCRTHWDEDALSMSDILAMLHSATVSERAFCIQSFGETPLSTIRTSLDEFYSETDRKKHRATTDAA